VRLRLGLGRRLDEKKENINVSIIVTRNLEIRRYFGQRLFVYGCETWSLPTREEDRPKVFQNWLPSKTCG
jgi:hypothetical protein